MARKMKDSGVPWLGIIPNEWRVCPVKTIVKWKSVKGYPDAQVLSLYRDYGVVPKDSRDDNHNVTSLDTSSYKLVNAGDLVINKMKAWQGSLAVSDYDGIVSPAYHVCQIVSPLINKKYLHYLLRDQSYLPEYMRLSTGLRIGQWDLGFEEFKNIPILLPSMQEQQEIAFELDKECSRIDEVIAKTKESIKDYKKLKQAVITEAVTKGVRKNHTLVEIRDTRWDKIPATWKMTRVKNCVESVSSGLSAITGEVDSEYSGNYVLRTSSVSTGVFIPTEVKPVLLNATNRLVCPVEKGTIVMSRMNTTAMVGSCAYVDDDYPNLYLPDKLWKIKVKDHCLAKYFWYVLNSPPARCWYSQISTGTSDSMQNISIGDFESNYITLPDILEQQEIVDYLDSKCPEIDVAISKKTGLIDQLESYKKSLIFEYVTGKKEIPA